MEVTRLSILQEKVDKNIFVDVSKGAHEALGATPKELRESIQALRDLGYGYYFHSVRQKGTLRAVVVRILTAPGITYKEVYANIDKVVKL